MEGSLQHYGIIHTLSKQEAPQTKVLIKILLLCLTALHQMMLLSTLAHNFFYSGEIGIDFLPASSRVISFQHQTGQMYFSYKVPREILTFILWLNLHEALFAIVILLGQSVESILNYICCVLPPEMERKVIGGLKIEKCTGGVAKRIL